MNLTSLAAVKRACALGAALEIVDADESRPHLLLTQEQGPREIVRVQGNAIAVRGCHRSIGDGQFEFDPDVVAWLYWPKAAEIEPHGDDTFTYRGLARYRVISREAVAA